MKDFKKRATVAAIFAIVYGLFVFTVVGWRADHTIIVSFVSGLLLLHRYSYRVPFILFGFLLFLIIYDALPALPNYTVNKVHIIEPYNLELQLFGIQDGDQRVVPSEWFATRLHDVLSLIAGFSYVLWMPLPIAYAIFLYFRDHRLMIDFNTLFLVVCIIGMIGYYIYPAAPPWYYINHGVGTDFTIPGSEGMLADFDRIVGAPVFNGIYAKGANVFCAIPSLHCAYPVVCFLIALERKVHWQTALFGLWALGTWFAAVYSQHHYVIDVILGVLCAILSYGLLRWMRSQTWYDRFSRYIVGQIV